MLSAGGCKTQHISLNAQSAFAILKEPGCSCPLRAMLKSGGYFR